MVKNRRRSTALKMACAGMLTALCLENIALGAFSVPVHAEELEDYTQEEQEFAQYFASYLDKKLIEFYSAESVAVQAELVPYLLTAQFASTYLEVTEMSREMVAPPGSSSTNYDVDVPARRISCGWYYRAQKPYSVVSFGYGIQDDPVIFQGGSVVLISGNDFTISASITANDNVAYPTIYSSNAFYMAYNIVCNGCHISDTGSSGIVIDDSANLYQSGVFYRIPFDDRVVTLDNVSYNLSEFANSGALGNLIPFGGLLKNANGQPISNTRQEFILGEVSGNFPDILVQLKSSLDDNFPPEIVDELWYDPIAGEPLPDVGNLDSLTFPPGLPSVDFNDIELPTEPLPAQMINGATFWFSSFSQMLDALGVKYIVITFLIIALVIAILKI